MKKLIKLSAFICIVLLGGCAKKEDIRLNTVIEPIRPYVGKVISEMTEIPEKRKEILGEIAADVSDQIKAGYHAQLVYICSHNSRRSHMAQLWARTAACYFGINNVSFYSGGTEATEFNIRTAAALRRVGFSVVSISDEENPEYLIQFSDDHPPMKAFSKLYNEGGNPKDKFIALMCCSQADKQCPVVEGADSRYAIHYVDPKESDDTNEEVSAYDSRCREIAHEMFYLMSQVST